MKLNMSSRENERKSDAKKLRRSGEIPAIIYAKGKDSEPVAVKSSEITALLRGVQPGHLSTTIFTLVDGKGKQRRAILKDIQYKVTTYEIIHLDFEELHDDVPISIKVPIEFTGVVDCVGVKLGGFLRQVIRSLRVRCLPKDIPAAFELDVKNLGLGESRRLADISLPKNVRPVANLNSVAVTVSRR